MTHEFPADVLDDAVTRIDAHDHRREFLRLIEPLDGADHQVPPAEVSDTDPPEPRRYNLTDVGNVERFVDQHGDDFRYNASRGNWLRWTGARWELDDKGAVVEAVKRTARSLFVEIATFPQAERQNAARWALRSETAQRIDAVIRLARSAPGIPVSVDMLDANPFLLNCLNGTVDLRTGQLRPHDRADLCTKLAPVDYDPDADAPVWSQVINRALPDGDVRDFFAKACGYSLTGDVSEQVLLIAHGTGANSKSTILRALGDVIGDYAQAADPDLLMAKRDAHPTGIARLQGARLVVASESDAGRRLAEDVVKRLTGGDMVTARFMGRDFFEFPPTHKIWLQTNHRPTVRGTDHAIWRRLRLIPFTVTIPTQEQDARLHVKLAAESAGILAWAVRGCVRWQSDGLTPPRAVQLATEAYKADSDVLGQFLADDCDSSDPDAVTPASDIYTAYKNWCEANGERVQRQRDLGQALTERGYEHRKHGPKRRSHWFGIALNKT